MAAASLKCTFWSRAVVFNTSIISWVSLLAEPSQARLTVSPSFTILSTGATPEARIMLDTGLWLTFTSYCLKMSKSSSSMQTQCTAIKSGPINPRRSRWGMVLPPLTSLQYLSSSSDSSTCMVRGICISSAILRISR